MIQRAVACVVNKLSKVKKIDIGVVFKKGKVFKKVEEENLVKELVSEIKNMTS